MKKFPNEKQKVGSSVCGPLCLLNIYEYLGCDCELDDILEDLGIEDKEITYLPQLALHARKKGLSTKYFQSNPREVSPTWKGQNASRYIEKFKKWIKLQSDDNIWKKNAGYLVKYIQNGGQIEIGDLSSKKISKYLADGYVVLVALEQTWLWGKRKVKGKIEYDDLKGKASGHFVVIYGENEKEFFVSDPYPTKLDNREGLYKVTKDTLLVSILVWGAQVVGIKK